MRDLTRRAVLAALPLSLGSGEALKASSPDGRSSTKKSRPLPAVGEFVRFVDPLTESIVVRLTSPASVSLLPDFRNRFISIKERALIFSSDRAGNMAPFRLDLRTGTVMQLASTAQLDPQSLCLDNSGKSLYLIDGGSLKEIAVGGKRARTLAEEVSAFSLGASRTIALVRKGRLYLLESSEPVADQAASWCLLRPGNSGCLFGREQEGVAEFWYVALGGQKSAATLLTRGAVSNPVWSPDGASILFLSRNDSGGSEIHELNPETKQERKISGVIQFAAFSLNHDGSVFVGARNSKAQPAIVLLLRSFQRELTLCEHRASHPAAVSPVFSPDSRRVYFQSDVHGKSAIYTVSVELLVEPASDNSSSENCRSGNSPIAV